MPSSCTCSMEVINFFVSMESSVNVMLLYLCTVLEVSVHTECECFAEHLEKQINCMMVLFLHCLLCLLGNDFTSCQWITLASWWNTILLLVSGTTLFFNFDSCAINSVSCVWPRKKALWKRVITWAALKYLTLLNDMWSRLCPHSEHRFLAPSSSLCQIWLRHWRGTFYICTAVQWCSQHPPKGLGTNMTVEAA